jgi:hypothetical protein
MKSFILMLIAVIVVSIITAPLVAYKSFQKWKQDESLSDYFHVITLGFDQAGGSILYGQEDWTVSSWTYHLAMCGDADAKEFMIFIDGLFGKDHCKNSFYKEAEKLKFIAEWM